jgi:hypothetical protein
MTNLLPLTKHRDYILSNKEETPRVYFIKEAIEKCIRLSYFERIQKTLPEDFQSFLPNKPAPNFKYDSGTYLYSQRDIDSFS